jgi:RNA polymerase sigma factor (sigma-70 family)
MSNNDLIPHLFRTEFSKITAVLIKRLGIEHMEAAEDIAGETFLSALDIWPYKGVPENPAAWLYTVAKNKAKNYISRNQLYTDKVSVNIEQPDSEEMDIDLSGRNISDSFLQMLFAVCHPAIPAESQIALALRILCGFGIEEIANAFLTRKETINKRLYRAKEKLRQEKIKIELPAPGEIARRLDTVLTTLYLLFNEGYYSETNDTVLQTDFCIEAMRLTALLMENEQTNQTNVNALYALMCFHASRFPARTKRNSEVVLYDEQDESLWDRLLITKGAYYLKQASRGQTLSTYHLEAGIAYWHTVKADTEEKWENILQLYNKLLRLKYSPVAALNRTYAVWKANGRNQAIIEAEKLNLTTNHYYYTLLAELYKESQPLKALDNLERALILAKSKADKSMLMQRIALLKKTLT